MTARIEPSQNGMWLVRCGDCSFTYPGVSYERGKRLAAEHEPSCPGQVRSENPANYRRRA